MAPVLWGMVSNPPNLCDEALAPKTSGCDLFWERGH